MAYRIYDLRSASTPQFEYYLLDANVLIAYYEPPNPTDRDWTRFIKPYIDFIEDILSCYFVESNKPKPKIIITSLLLSEFINAYMRNVSFKAYKPLWTGSKPVRFKEDFRPTPRYTRDLKELIANLERLYAIGCIELVDDNFTKLNPFVELLSAVNAQSDFNDLYYYTLLKNRPNTAIVTNDTDFAFQNFPIITTHGRLIKLN